MKQIANQYEFDASERKVTIEGLSIPQARLLLIVNATRNQILYNFAGGPGSTAYAAEGGNTVVTLAADTTAFPDSDSLTIYYDDGASHEEVTTLTDIDSIKGSNPASWLAAGDVPVGGLNLGSKADLASTEVSGDWSLIALAKGILAQVFGKFPTPSDGRIPVDIGGNGSITITSGTITVENEVEVNNGEGNPIPVTAQAYSGGLQTIEGQLTDATSTQVLPPALNSRRYLFIQNLSSAPIYLNFTPAIGSAPATPNSMRLDAGASLSFEGNFVPNSAVNLLRSATTNQRYFLMHASY